MKNRNLFLSLILGSMTILSQPVVYFDFVTHNEDQGPWNSTLYYTADRSYLMSLANYFQANGITMNMQSDWLYLTNTISKETPALQATTNNKSILRWMYEDKGVEMDPHGHEQNYIYPDLVKLMDSIGLPESKLMGGSLYGTYNGINLWSNLINGQFGNVFPNKFWQPNYLMGGGSPMHIADLNYYGFWNPQDTDNYLTHYPSNQLRHIGTGCEIKIKDTSNVAVIAAKLRDVVQKVQSGQYPATGFYIQTIFFGHGDLNDSAFYAKLIEVADSANAIVATGAAQWKTLKQAYTIWENVNNAQMFQWECGATSTGVTDVSGQNVLVISPNPASDLLSITSMHDPIKQISIRNILGAEVKSLEADNVPVVILEINELNTGMYFVVVNGKSAVKVQVLR